ncbi:MULTISPECIES: type II toxin -antitoxin system TacA 1-like antitoxin [unclassified Photorhabdus]|uniref:type II toxin -antitoxin system TacA 1-like antitoxin n=1 Tax=unclassified Photorhabdus TaxID=2620880 RepID=UPI002106D1B4|nr:MULTISPECIES: DUF1778 domain-containing protein [unclassified Photorhabdus]MCT8342871.1 DUF1778 domain-containing protein [Photorhabdus kleinii]
MQTVSKEAQKMIEENSKIILSLEDKKLILYLLNNPPNPNNKLKTAALNELLDTNVISGTKSIPRRINRQLYYSTVTLAWPRCRRCNPSVFSEKTF